MTTLQMHAHKIIAVVILAATVVIVSLILSLNIGGVMGTVSTEVITIRNDGGTVSNPNGTIFDMPIIGEDPAGVSENHGKHQGFSIRTVPAPEPTVPTQLIQEVPVTPATLPPTSAPRYRDCTTEQECAAMSVYGSEAGQIAVMP